MDIPTDRIAVLMYHRVGKVESSAETKYCVAPERFRQQMFRLRDRGFRAVNASDFISWLNGRRTLAPGSFVITFDDGYLGVYEHAASILEALGWRATVFLVSGRIGAMDEWEQEGALAGRHPLMDRRHIEALAQRGFEFHCHSRLHRDLTLVDDASLMEEVDVARRELADGHGIAARYFAYPYGRFDARVVGRVRAAGYEAAFSVLPGFNRIDTDRFAIRRLDVFGTDTPAMLERKLMLGGNDGSFRTIARYYARQLARRVGFRGRTAA
jgi:peptidoglycan/xylan/chitin deacetylase (PgdA/CDA1 family)